jgi:hypothetical protein
MMLGIDGPHDSLPELTYPFHDRDFL